MELGFHVIYCSFNMIVIVKRRVDCGCLRGFKEFVPCANCYLIRPRHKNVRPPQTASFFCLPGGVTKGTEFIE